MADDPARIDDLAGSAVVLSRIREYADVLEQDSAAVERVQPQPNFAGGLCLISGASAPA
jgi:hypothetical protein